MKQHARPFRFQDTDEAALYEERAAIREFEGGLSRAAAERLAMLDILGLRDLTRRGVAKRAAC